MKLLHQEPQEKPVEVKKDRSISKKERIKKQKFEERKARVLRKMETIQNENKESHDFEQAMMSTHEGIMNYYSSNK